MAESCPSEKLASVDFLADHEDTEAGAKEFDFACLSDSLPRDAPIVGVGPAGEGCTNNRGARGMRGGHGIWSKFVFLNG